jgi:subtilase family serine protease
MYFFIFLQILLFKLTKADNVTNEDYVLIESAKLNENSRSFNLKLLSRSNSSSLHTIKIVCKRINMDKVQHHLLNNFNNQMTRLELNKLVYQPKSIQYVVNYLKSNNIKVKTKSNNLLTATSYIGNFEKLFRTQFFEYEMKNEFYNSTVKLNRVVEYSLPRHLANHVEFIHYMNHFPSIITKRPELFEIKNDYKFYNDNKKKFSSAIYNGYVSPQLLFNYYHVSGKKGNNLGSQAFFGSIGQKYNPTDLSSFQSFFQLKTQGVAGSYGVNNVSTRSCSLSSGDCNEANLDVQYIMAISQETPTYYNYYSDNNGMLDWAAWLATIEAMDDPPYVISISYGSGEPSTSSFSQFDASAMLLAARGVTLIASSGDFGVHWSNTCDYVPMFPASSQYVTAVGATMGPESGSSEIVCSYANGNFVLFCLIALIDYYVFIFLFF